MILLIRISSCSRWLEGYDYAHKDIIMLKIVGRIWRLELRPRCGAGYTDMSRGGRIVSKEMIIIKKTSKQANKQTNADMSRGAYCFRTSSS